MTVHIKEQWSSDVIFFSGSLHWPSLRADLQWSVTEGQVHFHHPAGESHHNTQIWYFVMDFRQKNKLSHCHPFYLHCGQIGRWGTRQLLDISENYQNTNHKNPYFYQTRKSMWCLILHEYNNSYITLQVKRCGREQKTKHVGCWRMSEILFFQQASVVLNIYASECLWRHFADSSQRAQSSLQKQAYSLKSFKWCDAKIKYRRYLPQLPSCWK